MCIHKQKIQISLPTGAKQILGLLDAHGFSAYVVGGCVRDWLMGQTPHDWDICTNAMPSEVKSCLSCHRIIDTGLKHGTVTVIVADGQYEVTTFRTESGYADHRHPDRVGYVSDLTEDLARRDFTINAIAYNDREGLVDPFGGQADIRNCIIRCVGDPNKRFQEDALRILRALRFASTMSFAVDVETATAATNACQTLSYVSEERIYAELCKIIMGQDVQRVLLNYSDIICTAVPELAAAKMTKQNSPYHCYNVYDHIAHTVENCHSSDLIVKLAALFHDVGKPSCRTTDERGDHFYGHAPVSADMADAALLRLKADNETRRSVVELIRYHDAVLLPTKSAIRKWIGKIGVDQFKRLIALHRADVLAHAPGVLDAVLKRLVEVEMVLDHVLSEPPMFSVKDLAVSGRDILDLGVPQGPVVGVILNYLLDLVIAGECENERDGLMRLARVKVSQIGGFGA